MKKLTTEEVAIMAGVLGFTSQETTEIAEIFYEEKQQGNHRLKYTKLETVEDYINEWELSWCRYSTWSELLKSEEEQSEGLTAEECEELQGDAIFRLSTGMYIQSVV